MASSIKTKQYEAMFLFGATFINETDKAQDICRRIIEAHGGQILVLKRWGEDRKLAYEVQGNKRGVYFLALFNAPPAAVAQIERDVKLSEEVLRVMVLTADHVTADEIQAMEPQKPEPREERPDRGFGDRGGFGGGGYGGGGYGGGGYGDRDRGPRGPRRDEPSDEPAGADKPE